MSQHDIYNSSSGEISELIEITKASPDGADAQFIRFLECCYESSISREDDARHLEQLLALIDAEPDQQLWL